MIKYETGGYYGEGIFILEKEVERESEKSVWLKGGRRRDKTTTYYRYHDTWQEAHAHLMEIAERRVANAQYALDKAKESFGKLAVLKP